MPKTTKQECYLRSNPLVFLKLHGFPSLFFQFNKKKKKKKKGFSKLPNKTNLLASKKKIVGGSPETKLISVGLKFSMLSKIYVTLGSSCS